MLAIVGLLLVLLGVLALVNLVPIGLVGAIVCIVGGVLLIAYDRGAFRRV